MTVTDTRRNIAVASSLTEARAAYVAARPKSQALHKRALAVMPGGNTQILTAAVADALDERGERMRERFFVDMMRAGICLARRGMAALSLPMAQAELDRFVSAVAEFVEGRGSPLRSIAH